MQQVKFRRYLNQFILLVVAFINCNLLLIYMSTHFIAVISKAHQTKNTGDAAIYSLFLAGVSCNRKWKFKTCCSIFSISHHAACLLDTAKRVNMDVVPLSMLDLLFQSCVYTQYISHQVCVWLAAKRRFIEIRYQEDNKTTCGLSHRLAAYLTVYRSHYTPA